MQGTHFPIRSLAKREVDMRWKGLALRCWHSNSGQSIASSNKHTLLVGIIFGKDMPKRVFMQHYESLHFEGNSVCSEEVYSFDASGH